MMSREVRMMERDTGSAGGAAWKDTGLVLIVDDLEGVRMVVARSVERFGFDTCEASNGAEAIALFESNPAGFRVAIIDLKMPVMDGMELARRLRSLRPDFPILLMSGFNHNQALVEINPAVPTGFLHKPFTLSDLRRELRSTLGA
jgi:CheY-like chemotaxis protein